MPSPQIFINIFEVVFVVSFIPILIVAWCIFFYHVGQLIARVVHGDGKEVD